MPRIHVLDQLLQEDGVKAYEDVNEIDLQKIKTYTEYDIEESDSNMLKEVELEDGKIIKCYFDGVEFFHDSKGIVYAPVYDVERPMNEDYSLYEKEDLLGFVCMDYDYREI